MLVMNKLQPSESNTSVALGCFDGIHLGHLEVISRAVKNAENLTPTVFTFSETPFVKMPTLSGGNIITPDSKRQLLDKTGVAQLYEIDFLSVMHMEANEFVKVVLHETLKAKKVFCGFNYHFAKGGFRTASDLKNICKRYDISVEIVPAVVLDGKIVSSTKIKNLISSGDMVGARQMLGRYFSISGSVVHGNKIGGTLDIPTANQIFPETLIQPKFGVYASRVTLDDKYFLGVTNVGVKPTIGEVVPSVETWLPNYTGENFYGKFINVDLLQFVRPERKFESLQQLKQAVLQDAEKAKRIYKQKTRTD